MFVSPRDVHRDRIFNSKFEFDFESQLIYYGTIITHITDVDVSARKAFFSFSSGLPGQKVHNCVQYNCTVIE